MRPSRRSAAALATFGAASFSTTVFKAFQFSHLWGESKNSCRFPAHSGFGEDWQENREAQGLQLDLYE